MKTVYIKLILIIFLNTTLLSNCNFPTSNYLNELNDFSKIKAIDVNIRKSKKWIKNFLKIIVSDLTYIDLAYKKKFNASIKVKYDFGECNYPARIRINGDWLDHISMVKNMPYPSLDLKLKEGNIAGKIKFKLLLPETRNNINEIYFTQLLRSLGFIAPLTSIVKVKQNDTTSKMLFQEKAAKELVEGMKYRESVLLEGDESFLVGYEEYEPFLKKDISLSKIINSAWAKKGDNSWEISKNALLKLQTAYLYQRLTDEWQYIDTNYLTNDIDIKNKWKQFHILLYGARAMHGGTLHNRKYYWNYFNTSFEPIYYDGDVDPKRKKPALLNESTLKEFYQTTTKEECDNLIKNIRSINKKEYLKNLKKRGLSLKEIEDSNEFIEQIIKNLNSLKDTISKTPKELSKKYTYKNRMELYKKRLFEQKTKFYIANIEEVKVNLVQISICDKNSCEKKVYTKKELVDLFDKSGVVIPKNVVLLNSSSLTKSAKNKKSKITNINQINIEHTFSSKVTFDEETNSINLEARNSNDWFLIKNSNINNLSIKWNGSKVKKINKQDSQRFNEYGLTGCLSFYNVKFNKTKIYSQGAYCEDAINIINSQGNIDYVNINQASADALDIDFSEIKINKTIITNAMNDCIDVSSGNYEINNSKLINCQDKAISVGEESKMSIKNTIIKNAHIAISAKDSSIVHIKNLDQKNTKICAQAYNKKQEFNGAILKFDNMNCDSFNKDIHSKIEVLGVKNEL